MFDCARSVRDLAPDSLAELKRDLKTQLALARLIEIMGEAANHVDPELQDAHPEIPWRVVIATRNRVTHGYAGVDLQIVWQLVTDRVPELIPLLRALLDEVGDPGPSGWLGGNAPHNVAT